MDFDRRGIDLDCLNSMTKYPPIPTYHAMDPSNGMLQEDQPTEFMGTVVVTEKIDGTNARIILLPDKSWIIGSREELLTASGDLIIDPTLGIVRTLMHTADRLAESYTDDFITVLYGEVYGGGIGSNWKQYSARKDVTGFRVFDVGQYQNWYEILGWQREHIASWRDHGSQPWMPELTLEMVCRDWDIQRVPVLAQLRADTLPQDLQFTLQWLATVTNTTSQAWLSPSATKRPEGVVIRSLARSKIVKARFADYTGTLRRLREA
jgi:hypothetical protein